MSNVEAASKMTPYQLAEDLERFIRHNDMSRDESDRWLAHFARENWLPVVREVRNNNIGPDLRAKIHEFRLREIEQERTRLQAQMDKLTREAGLIEARSR
jgi:hypothetical protein